MIFFILVIIFLICSRVTVILVLGGLDHLERVEDLRITMEEEEEALMQEEEEGLVQEPASQKTLGSTRRKERRT